MNTETPNDFRHYDIYRNAVQRRMTRQRRLRNTFGVATIILVTLGVVGTLILLKR